MTLAVALLTLLSAALHPLWNLLVKRDAHPTGSMLYISTASALIALTHSLVTGVDLFTALTFWPLIALSAAGQLLYGTALAATLKRGDLSTYYPIIRSTPLGVVVVGVLFLGRTYELSTLLGIALVLAGIFALLYRPNANLLADPAAFGLALAAMGGTVVYSLADAAVVRQVPPQALYFWVQVLCIPGYVVILRVLGLSRPRLLGLGRLAEAPGRALLLPALVYGSYVLILTAYELGGDVAAVSAVRQVSIPLSVLLGAMVLREQGLWRRLAGGCTVTAGVVAIIIFG